jgi:hypothetical protein
MSTNHLSHPSRSPHFSDLCALHCKLQLRNQTAFPVPISNLLRQHVAVVSAKLAIAAKYQAISTVAAPRFSTPITGTEPRAILPKIWIKVQLLLRQLPVIRAS